MKWLTPNRISAALLILTLITGAANLIATNIEVTAAHRSDAAQQRKLRAVAVTLGQLHAAEVAFCQDSNQSRAQNVALWVHIYNIGVTAQTPPKQRAADNDLIAYIKMVFAPRDCKAVYRLPGG